MQVQTSNDKHTFLIPGSKISIKRKLFQLQLYVFKHYRGTFSPLMSVIFHEASYSFFFQKEIGEPSKAIVCSPPETVCVWNWWVYLSAYLCCVSVLMCSAGQSMNRWSLEELVKRDPENFLILLQQIIRKTKEVRGRRALSKTTQGVSNEITVCFTVCFQAQEQCQYELVAPLAIMFSSTLLQVQTVSFVTSSVHLTSCHL